MIQQLAFFFQDLDETWRRIRAGEDEILSALELALSELNYQSELFNISFRADSSCILTDDSGSAVDVLVRGYFSNSGWLWSKDATYDEAMREEAIARKKVVSNAFGKAVRIMNNYRNDDPVWGYTRNDMEFVPTYCAFYELPVQVLIGRSAEDNSFFVEAIIPLVDPTDYFEAPEKGNNSINWSLTTLASND